MRPVVFDLTHLVSRLSKVASSGIDRVDLAYATHFAGQDRLSAAVHYGLIRPHLYSADEARNAARFAASLWARDERGGQSHFARVVDWLHSRPADGRPKPGPQPPKAMRSRWTRRVRQAKGRLIHNRAMSIPRDAIYLNVAQHLFEHPLFFRWLKRRSDVSPVFMIHDLLPLDYPEFFSRSNLAVFERRMATAFLHAKAFIVSTQAVQSRLERELHRRGAPRRPIWRRALPSPLEAQGITSSEKAPAGHPYFVMLGTIEPRKNHLLLLHLWRSLVRNDPEAPRLVLIGVRGWENEQVADILDRSLALKNHVLEIRGLASADLVELLSGARALLMPSFDEGYGLPLIEALSLGVPAVVSDIPVFHEVSQGRAAFLSPLNGEAWREAVLKLTADGEYAASKRMDARAFEPPAWADYFCGLDAFLADL